jgi:thioester reductase-like protein
MTFHASTATTVLLTGATGALGGELLTFLAKRGHEVVCLIRAKNRFAALQRLDPVISANPRVKVVCGDITQPRCGISDPDRQYLSGRVKVLLHCAASIDFHDRTTNHLTNVRGVHHVLELADLLNVPNLHHVSTVFVAGSVPIFRENDELSTMRHRPRNYYEESKQIGEFLVRSWASCRQDRRAVIYRPSMLIGRDDGSTPTFDAYYSYFKPIHLLAETVRSWPRKRKPLPDDIRVTDSGIVDFPLVLEASGTAAVNLVPIDWVAKTIVMLVESRAQRDTYHLVHPNPQPVQWTINASLAHLKIKGVHVLEGPEKKAAMVRKQSPLVRSFFQRKLDSMMAQFHPYTCHDVRFEMEAARQILGKEFSNPRIVDQEYIGRLLSYVAAVDWGRALLPAANAIAVIPDELAPRTTSAVGQG